MKAKKEITKTDTKEVAGEPLIKSPNLFPVVGIGASAGGLDAFKKLLKAIPEDSGMAYVLVQHLDPSHESLLPEILQKVTKVPVLEITDDIKVLPDHIYVIPSNKMMVATDGVLLLAPRPAKNKTERNLPIDLFFASLAEVHQEHAIGVVLSGTASDGTQGLKAIKENGGITFAQDEASAEYEGMPHSAAQAGVVDFILPPGEIPKKLLEVTSKIKLSDEELQNIPKQDEDVFKQILSLLRIRKGVDFTYYKQTTVRRRILRRMLVNKNEEPADYLKFLRGSTPEQDFLYQDMLIPVTSFFRDKKTFENLCNNVFPAIVKNKIPGEITRIWVAGCSTGQEAYSFAICFKEFLGDDHERIQIFGTDLSEPTITKARTGIYEKNELDSVSPQRLKEFFTKNNGGYQINKSIRDMCVFAHHNFLKDPPFGKMDCISCRNVLIYMEPYLQKKALTTFHYALNPKGFLLLGKSETTGGVPDLFAAVEKNDKLYTRKDVPGRFMQVASQRSEQILNRSVEYSKNETSRTDFQKTADDILLSKYTPGGVVVNETMDIVHFRGNTANYLEQAPGKPSHNLLVMAKSGLGFELRNILHKAKADQAAVVKDNIPLNINGSIRNISIEAVPLPNTLEPYYLILFHDNNLTDTDGSVTGNRKKVSPKAKKDEKDIQIKLLEHELAQAREDMRSITEEQEAANEELQSANEELLSGSEELQSLNEELETSKEELQSTNEELTVLNHELISLNDHVTDARNYSESILGTLYQPLLVLDKYLRVKTANKAFYKTFKVEESETEGVLIYDLGNRQWNIPELRRLLEEILPEKKSITDFEVTHNFSSIGERTILLNALEIVREKREEKLILLSIEDVTEKVFAQKKIEQSEKRYDELVRSSPSLIAICKGENMVIEIANDAILETWGKGNIIGQPLFDAVPESREQDFDKLLLDVYKTGLPWQAFEVPATLLRKGKKELGYYNILYQPQRNVDGEIEGVAIISTEVTPQAEYNLKIKANEEQFRSLVMQAPVAICIFKGSDFVVEVANKYFLNLVGKTENEYVGKPVFDSVPETKTIVEPLLQGVLKTGVPYFGNEVENTINRFGKTDKGFWNFVYQPIIGDDGTATGIIVVVHEVTEQVLARKKIEESETKYRSLFDTMDQGFCIAEVIFDKDNNPVDYLFVEVNPVFEKQSGLKDAAGKTALQLLPNLEKFWIDVYGKVVTTGESMRFVESSDVMGRIFDVYAFKVGEAESRRVAMLFTDITEQKRVEKNLIESEERFRSLVMATSNTVYKMSADWKIMYNLEGKDFLADTTDSNISWLEKYIPEAERSLVIKAIEEAIAKKKIFELEHQVFDTDGNIAWTYSRAVPKLNEEGEIIEWAGAASNITERKRAEKNLIESEAQFNTLANNIHNLAWMADADGWIFWYNTRWFEYTGTTAEEMEGWGWKSVHDPEQLPAVLERWQHSINTGEPFEMVFPLRGADEIFRPFLTRVIPMHDNVGKVTRWIGTNTDISEQKKQSEIIEESEKKFRQMAELMPQKVWTSDAKGNKDYFNKTLLDYAGKSFEELEGSGWQQIIHPDDWEENKNKWEESISTGKNYEAQNRLLRKDGKYLWHLTQAVALKSEDGKIKTWVGAKTEIQEQIEQKEVLENAVLKRTHELQEANKELEQKNQELFITKEKLLTEYSRSLIEASLDPFVTINADGKITDANQASILVTGIKKDELIGTSFSDYFTEPEKAQKGYQQAFEKGFIADYPLTIKHKNGDLKDVLYNASVYKDEMGNVLGIFAAARDVTEQKRISKELTEAIVFAELATGIAEEAKVNAENATQIAEDAVKAKQQFLSNMSHEIRTPMNAIIGFTKVVLKTDLTAKQKEYLTAIKLSGNSLIVLINDILDLAKVDAGQMSFEEIPFKMSSSVSAMIHLFETKVQEKNILLVKDYDDRIPEVLLGDPVRLHQIILNLVSNAVKFTSKGKITVAVHLLNDDKKNVLIEFTVSDTGIGIPKNKTEKIFEKFQQASNDTSRLYGGTGLGLSIVKQLVESQGGNIRVSSNVGEGSVFSFTLSFKKTEKAAEEETEILEIDAENKNIKVLVVEDIALNQLLMKTLLDEFGFERDIAANGKIAIEKLQEKDYDIILMDLQMPEMNGFEATEYIRNKMHSKIPIIALTADVTTVDLEKCKAVGMNDYIAKPVDERILYSKIVGLVKKPAEIKYKLPEVNDTALEKKLRCTDLTYLINITKYDHKLMMEMIALYLEQTPPLISILKKSLQDKDWESLHTAAHKMVPSFSIMGIDKDFENKAKKVQEYKGAKEDAAEIQELVLQLENICSLACKELEEEFNTLKNTIA